MQWEESLAKSSYNLPKKALRFMLLYLRYMWGEELPENVKIPSYGERFKIA